MSEHTHATNLAVSGAASPKQREESRRFDPVAFEHDPAVRPHNEPHDRVQTLNVDAEILAALGSNICRCTGYVKIIEAVKFAVALGKQGVAP